LHDYAVSAWAQACRSGLPSLAPQVWRCVIFYGESPPLEDVGKINPAFLELYGGNHPASSLARPRFVK
jgi:hypothetical protein